jgi:cytochrome c biogenesis protein CcdA/peroxiredoxin
MEVSYWLAFIAGLVSFLSPCVLPLVPAYIGYMGGRVTHTVAAQAGGGAVALRPSVGARFSTLLHGLAFVAGFTFVFVVFGLLTTAFIRQIGGSNIALVRDVIGRVGGLLIIFFGLHFMGVIPSLANRLLANKKLINNVLLSVAFALIVALLILWAFVDWLIGLPIAAVIILWMFLSGAFNTPGAFWTKTITSMQRALYADTRRQMVASGQQSYSSSVIMGVVFSAGWTPCIGPIYGSILTMAAGGGDVGQAGSLLLAYSLGLGIPFLLTALLLDGAQGILRRLQRSLRTIELVSGSFLVLIGVLVASGQLQSLSQNFANQFSDFSYNLERCAERVATGELGLGQFVPCVNGELAEPALGAESAAPVAASAAGSITGLAETVGDSPAVGTDIGLLAPNFETTTEAGETVTLADLRGQVVLLNFWATWCGPCRVEMPEFERAYTERVGEGFTVVAVNFEESAEDVGGFREEYVLSFPLALDEQGTINRLYGVTSYPSTFLIDRDGVIRARYFGPLTDIQIAALVDEALVG